MSNFEPAVERVGIATSGNVADHAQSGNTPSFAAGAQLARIAEEVHSLDKGFSHLAALFTAIRTAAAQGDFGDVFFLADLGLEQANHRGEAATAAAEEIEETARLVERELCKPQIDMMQSGLQADAIKAAMFALLQTVPVEQVDLVGAIKTVSRLADGLANHLVTGGRYVFPEKDGIAPAEGFARFAQRGGA